MSKNTKALSTVPTEEALRELEQSFPQEKGSTRILHPRLTLVSQDITEEVKNAKGKKEIKVITEAGTFIEEMQGDEEDEDTGKKVWTKHELGTEIEGVILFRRKQLKFYDGEAYTSSPVYDEDDQILPLFKDKAEVDRGTPSELRSRPIYQGKSAKGKPISKLEETRVIYVLCDGVVHQLNLRGTSMYAYLTYAKSVMPPAVLTRFSSEPKENGAIAWSQMTFEKVRTLSAEEVAEVQGHIDEIRKGVADEKEFYQSTNKKSVAELVEMEKMKELDDLSDEAGKLLE